MLIIACFHLIVYKYTGTILTINVPRNNKFPNVAPKKKSVIKVNITITEQWNLIIYHTFSIMCIFDVARTYLSGFR